MIKNNHQTLFSCAEVAAKLGLSPDHIRRLISQGKIKAEKFGNAWMIPAKAFAHVKRQRFPRAVQEKGVTTNGA